MKVHKERRECERHPHDALIVYAYHDSDEFYNATICNYSKSGMCFETLDAINPGADIYIMMENFSPDAIGSEIYDGFLAEVKWCQDVSDFKEKRYKIGVKYYQTVIK